MSPLVPAALFGAFAIAWVAVAWSRRRPLSDFNALLVRVIRQNFPLPGAIAAYAADLDGFAGFRRWALEEIARRLEAGTPLSQALTLEPRRFPAPYLALIRAGERGGNLAAVLEGATDLYEFEDTLLSRIVVSTLYPVGLVALACAVYEIGRGLVGRFVARYLVSYHGVGVGPDTGVLPYLLPLVISIGLVLAVALALGTSRFRPLFPPLGRYQRQNAASRFAFVAGRLLSAGVPDVEAFRLAHGTVADARARGILDAAIAGVEEGQAFSQALARADSRHDLPDSFHWFVASGEASGDLPGALARAAEVSATRSRLALESIARIVAPAGIVGAAFAIGSIGYAMLDAYRLLIAGLDGG